MKVKDVKFDLEELKKWKKQNSKERLSFVRYWVEYMKSHSDREWSRQQNVIIDSQINGKTKK
jgi:hypothetical protein